MLQEVAGDIPVVEAQKGWIKEGLLAIKSEAIQVMDICPFDLRMEGDEKLSAHLVHKG
jgi:hypothetical protein